MQHHGLSMDQGPAGLNDALAGFQFKVTPWAYQRWSSLPQLGACELPEAAQFLNSWGGRRCFQGELSLLPPTQMAA